MSTSIMKVFLLLAVAVCISQAQRYGLGMQCLCSRVMPLDTSDVKDVQIYPATIFCKRVEIVVTTNSGYRYCLDPKRRVVQQFVANIMNRQKASTPSPTTFSSTPTSSSSRSTQEPTAVATSMLSVFKEHGLGKPCLCSSVKRLVPSDVKDVQIFQATILCNRVEIVVTTNRGYRYCLDPKRRVMPKLLVKIMNRQKASTATPAPI
ncbi:uncharacterized protein AB9X84_024485 isoform 2-T2 [Acanthopagrus schlegelii]